MKLPYSAIILATILYDADRKDTCDITVNQREIAKRMNAHVNTVVNGIRHLEQAGIIISHKSIGDATEITLKAGIVPPKKQQGKQSGQAAAPYPQKNQRGTQQFSNSSIDIEAVKSKYNGES